MCGEAFMLVVFPRQGAQEALMIFWLFSILWRVGRAPEHREMDLADYETCLAALRLQCASRTKILKTKEVLLRNDTASRRSLFQQFNGPALLYISQ